MKCDELIEKIKQAYDDYRHKFIPINLDITIVDLLGAFAELKATAYTDSVDAGMCERKLKRALWLARANRAIEKIAWFKLWNASISTMNPEDGARQEYDKWKKALGKFLAKAEEFK